MPEINHADERASYYRAWRASVDEHSNRLHKAIVDELQFNPREAIGTKAALGLVRCALHMLVNLAESHEKLVDRNR